MMSVGNLQYFVIVSKEDCPIFEIELLNNSKRDDAMHLHQFILHASLDLIDEKIWDTTSMNLKVVDKFNDLFVSSYVTAGRSRLLLLHDIRNEDGIKAFFQEAHELYLKICMNPFHDTNSLIKSPTFEQRIIQLGKKYL